MSRTETARPSHQRVAGPNSAETLATVGGFSGADGLTAAEDGYRRMAERRQSSGPAPPDAPLPRHSHSRSRCGSGYPGNVVLKRFGRAVSELCHTAQRNGRAQSAPPELDGELHVARLGRRDKALRHRAPL